jgi:hypothetical protein
MGDEGQKDLDSQFAPLSECTLAKMVLVQRGLTALCLWALR